MSIEVQAKVVCDGCGASVTGPVARTASDAPTAIWSAVRVAKNQKWVNLSRPYRRDKHYCQKCADGAPTNSSASGKGTGGQST